MDNFRKKIREYEAAPVLAPVTSLSKREKTPFPSPTANTEKSRDSMDRKRTRESNKDPRSYLESDMDVDLSFPPPVSMEEENEVFRLPIRGIRKRLDVRPAGNKGPEESAMHRRLSEMISELAEMRARIAGRPSNTGSIGSSHQDRTPVHPSSMAESGFEEKEETEKEGWDENRCYPAFLWCAKKNGEFQSKDIANSR